MKKIIIVDGYSLLFRTYYATAYNGQEIMRSKNGTPTNAIFGFGNVLNKIISSFKNDEGLIVGFDSVGPSFRKEQFPQYKANRPPCPEDLKTQMPIVREMLDALSIMRYEKTGFEGDDICGSIAKLASSKGYAVSIYTSDRDFLQLIDKNVSIEIMRKGVNDVVHVDENNIVELFGYTPQQLIDFKGLRGDTSDNLPGIPGVGEKTAIKLLNQYGTFENIIANASAIGGKLGQNIIDNSSLGQQSKELAKILTSVPLPFAIEELAYKGFSFDKINAFCQKYDLKTLLNRLPNSLKSGATKKLTFKVVNDLPHINFNSIGLYVESDNSNYHKSKIQSIAISDKENTYIIHRQDILNAKNLKLVLENSEIKKYVYDSKMIYVSLNKINIKIDGIKCDLLLAAYLLDSTLKNDVSSIMNYFNVDVGYKQKQMLLLENESDDLFAANVSYYSLYLKDKIEEEIARAQQIALYEKIELPLSRVLSEMEIEGVPLDVNEIDRCGFVFNEKLKRIADEIYTLANRNFNINSPKQVADVLFNLGLTKSQNSSTSSDILESIKNDHPIINKILQHRKYAKLISTYVDALKDHVFEDKKIHALFNQALTQTGRLSSSEPNLQNISVRDEEGKLIRKAFHYENNKFLIASFDYSQIELRVLAALSNSKTLIEMFNQNHDIHSETAKKIFHLQGEPTDNERRKAKVVNFGIIYGMSEFGLAKDLEISRLEAHDIITNFNYAFPEINGYQNNLYENARRNGYAMTYYNRRRWIRELNDENYQIREFGKRAAINAPIQGTAADLIKIAMIKVHKMLNDKKYNSKLILQIHDELIFKIDPQEKDTIIEDIKNCMENIDFPVKLKVSIGIGDTWYEAK